MNYLMGGYGLQLDAIAEVDKWKVLHQEISLRIILVLYSVRV